MASRDEALDELQQASEEYIEAEKTRIQNEVKYLKSVKQRLGGSSTLRGANEDRLATVLADSINVFLEN